MLNVLKYKVLFLCFAGTIALGSGLETLNKRSIINLQNVHPDLVKIVKQAADLDPQAGAVVIQGGRTLAQQKRNIAKGVSWTLNSKHLKQNTGYYHAVDIAIIRNGRLINDLRYYDDFASTMKEVAKVNNVCIIYGGDWRVRDGYHYEIC